MKRSENLAWASLAGLLVIAVVLLAGGVMYNATFMWAGMCLVLAQAFVVGLAGWGLRLARQRAELEEIPAMGGGTSADRGLAGFRMTTEETGAARPVTTAGAPSAGGETKTLDTGFQRLLVALASIFLLALAALVAFMVYRTFGWHANHADQPFPVAGSFEKPQLLDELSLVIALGATAAYVLLYSITRVRRETAGTGEAVNSNFTLGLLPMIAIAVAAILGYVKVAYASEMAASVTAALMALQGLELLLNAFRSYSAIEELDQQAIDLQALPFVPMLSSVWLGGVKMLFAQSVGLSRTTERGVLARMMPRAIGALVLIAIAVSCLRVVRPGRVAVLERLGEAQRKADGDILMLEPGLHVTLPWPIDLLTDIPIGEIQFTNVGAELHAPKGADKKTQAVDFQFWTVRDVSVTVGEDTEDQFATGDANSPQLLETFVTVMWRVKDPQKFYTSLSHSDFFEKEKGGEEIKSMPIYQEIVQQCASFAVTRAFAIHSLDDIMINNRHEVEEHCRQILQDKLNEQNGGIDSGIEIVDLTIKDLHPPYGIGMKNDPTSPGGVRLGPAHAYENVTSMREVRETLKNYGEASRLSQINLAHGAAANEISKAKGYAAEKVAKAQGEAARMIETMGGIDALPESERRFAVDLAEREARYRVLKDILTPVSKILVDPRMKEGINLYQTTEKGNAPAAGRPPGQ